MSTMKITFLIGNGFDIACGINTSYRAFYDWYLAQKSPNQHIQDLKDNIKNYGENWADFETGLGRYTERFSKVTALNFIDCYKDAQKSIINFLNEQVSKIDIDKIKDNDVTQFLTSILGFYDELPSGEAKKIKEKLDGTQEFRFISFNYTSILNDLIGLASEKCFEEKLYQPDGITINSNVINIHGTLKQSPILGVSAERQIVNKEILKIGHLKETIIKPYCIESLGESWYEDANDLIKSSDIICIFGMSLGDSDSIWWELIMEHLINNPNCNLIIYWHTKSPLSKSLTYDNIEIRNTVKKNICMYSALSDKEMQEISSRIHVVINSPKILNIVLPSSKEDINNKNGALQEIT